MEQPGNTVFVGQVPRDMIENDLRSFMEECGRVTHINMLTDRNTGQFKGCAFVTFETVESATRAKETMHDKRRLPGANHSMQVTTARSKSGMGPGSIGPPQSGGPHGHGHASSDMRADTHQPRRKLFVGMISRSLSDEDLRQTFLPFGDVEDGVILRNADKSSRGCAFVTMASMACCQKAIVALHNSQTFPGCSGPMVVKFADTQQQKEHRQRAPFPPPPHHHMGHNRGPPPGAMHPHAPPAGPPGGGYNHPHPPHVPGPPHGMGGGPDLSLPNLLAPTMAQLVKHQQELQQQQQAINQALQMLGLPGAAASSGRSEYGAPEPASAYGGGAPAAVGHYGVGAANPAGMGGPSGGAYDSMAPVGGPPAADVGAAGGGYRTGPEGSNLFIYHLASGASDSDLHSLFSPYGRVVSARVYCDRNTGQSKGFGFVSYDNVQSAQAAIDGLNGYQMGSRRLKVQLKKGRESARPY